MRIHVAIDDDLMSRALKIGGFSTKRGAIEEGLRLLAQMGTQRKLRRLKGEIDWEGDLDEMRRD